MSPTITECAQKSKTNTMETISLDGTIEQHADESGVVDPNKGVPPAGGFLWRMSSGIAGGLYNVAGNAVGAGYNTTKWALCKGADITGTVVHKTAEVGSTIVGKLPVPNLTKSKAKKE